jgi:hypothetical protein
MLTDVAGDLSGRGQGQESPTSNDFPRLLLYLTDALLEITIGFGRRSYSHDDLHFYLIYNNGDKNLDPNHNTAMSID